MPPKKKQLGNPNVDNPIREDLICVVDGAYASSAFVIFLNPRVIEVSHLKKLIWDEVKTPQDEQSFTHHDLILWYVDLSLKSTQITPTFRVLADNIPTKQLMLGGRLLEAYFKDGLYEEWSIDIIVRKPQIRDALPAVLPTTPSPTRNMAPLPQNNPMLYKFNVVLTPSHHPINLFRPDSLHYFDFEPDLNKVTVQDLLQVLYNQYPDRAPRSKDAEDRTVLAIRHQVASIPDLHQDHTERPSDDRLRAILWQYLLVYKLRTLTVMIETPFKDFSQDYTLKDLNNLFGLTKKSIDPALIDLPSFSGPILTENEEGEEPQEGQNQAFSQDTRDHIDDQDPNRHRSDRFKSAKRRLLEELDCRLQTMSTQPTRDPIACATFVGAFLTQAAMTFQGEMKIHLKRRIKSSHGSGVMDFSIEHRTYLHPHHLVVTMVKPDDTSFDRAVTQTFLLLEASLGRRRKKAVPEAKPVASTPALGSSSSSSAASSTPPPITTQPLPEKAFGIVTDSERWYFLECVAAKATFQPTFGITKLKNTIDYDNKLQWKTKASAILGEVVWLMHQMYSRIPPRVTVASGQKINSVSTNVAGTATTATITTDNAVISNTRSTDADAAASSSVSATLLDEPATTPKAPTTSKPRQVTKKRSLEEVAETADSNESRRSGDNVDRAGSSSTTGGKAAPGSTATPAKRSQRTRIQKGTSV
ncbi:hypothetical protein BGZ83_009335 [Gryganskiella cystojenkinii]|nr:hypothetical protein BGZ83_009335 [Gryganskiella cystojenkinii]